MAATPIDARDSMKVTLDCIRKIGHISPGEKIPQEAKLKKLGIPNDRMPSLKQKIATDDEIGLPSLKPFKFRIDESVLDISENTKVHEVFVIVDSKAIFDGPNP